MSKTVEIFEVGPRDGLQNEPRPIPTKDKVALIDLLSQAGFRRIEAASFVSPKWVPQMADGDQVMAQIQRRPGVRFAALTPNLQGYERALAAGVDEVAIFASASESFSRANINASIAESLERFRPLADRALHDGVQLRGYVSCVTDCPFEGRVAPQAVAGVAEALFKMGCHEIALGETLGRGDPDRVTMMLKAVLGVVPAPQLAGHFHDTGGLALQNICASLDLGLRVFDAAVGGLGGCPYAPGAAGNVATESVLNYLRSYGYEVKLNQDIVDQAAVLARAMRGGAQSG